MQTPHHRIVAVRRRNPLTLAVRDGGDGTVQVSAGTRVIGSVPVAPGRAAAVRALLARPVWLLAVAAEVQGDVVGRVWALVAADPAPHEAGELRDEDMVFALPLADVSGPRSLRANPGDLVAEVRQILARLVGEHAPSP
jgi:hypothetical protein